MSSRTKLFEKLASRQKDANWTLDEVEKLLGWKGFTRVGGKGSHRVFVHPHYDAPIVLAAHGNKIKTGYIREIRDAFQNIP